MIYNIKPLAGFAALLLILTTATSISSAEKPDTFRPLFDGKTLKGWHALGGGTWTVEDGLLVGRHKTSEPRHGHLFTDEEYADFTIRLKFKDIAGNSGLYFRTEKIKGNVGIRGFQAEIDARNDIGRLYETYGRGWVVKPKAADVKKYFKPDAWNEMIVTARGRNVTVHINGTKTAELKNDKGRLQASSPCSFTVDRRWKFISKTSRSRAIRSRNRARMKSRRKIRAEPSSSLRPS